MKIKLYGELRRKFGAEFELNVRSAGEAVNALCHMVKGFKEHFIVNSEPGYHVKVGREYIDKDELRNPSGEQVVRIVPYIAGAGKAFKIIVGIALIALAIANPTFMGMGTGALASFGSEQLIQFGLSMVLQGIAEVLFSPPKPPSPASREKNGTPSYAFDGPINTIEQGNPVPLCYGELVVGSQVISAVVIAKDL